MDVGRVGRLIATAIVLIAMAVPVVTDDDSFPLSTHPMYASVREPVESLSSAVGVDASGRVERLSLGLIARTDDPLIAQSFVTDAIRSDRADELCAEIGERVARSDRAPGLVRIDVVTETLDLVGFVTDEDPPLDRVVHSSCEVPR